MSNKQNRVSVSNETHPVGRKWWFLWYVVAGVLKLAPFPDKKPTMISKSVSALFHFNNNDAEFSPDYENNNS